MKKIVKEKKIEESVTSLSKETMLEVGKAIQNYLENGSHPMSHEEFIRTTNYNEVVERLKKEGRL
jgi:hypothetical protein